VDKELKVYRRRRVGGQGEKTIEEVVEEDTQSQSDVTKCTKYSSPKSLPGNLSYVFIPRNKR